MYSNWDKIYTLSCPLTGDVKYVGRSSSIDDRFKTHLLCLNGEKKEWLDKLKSLGLKPIIEIVDPVEWWFESALEAEVFWIQMFQTWGFTLFNKVGKIKYYKNNTIIINYNHRWNT